MIFQAGHTLMKSLLFKSAENSLSEAGGWVCVCVCVLARVGGLCVCM